jgi:hypothetical protein
MCLLLLSEKMSENRDYDTNQKSVDDKIGVADFSSGNIVFLFHDEGRLDEIQTDETNKGCKNEPRNLNRGSGHFSNEGTKLFFNF